MYTVVRFWITAHSDTVSHALITFLSHVMQEEEEVPEIACIAQLKSLLVTLHSFKNVRLKINKKNLSLISYGCEKWITI